MTKDVGVTVTTWVGVGAITTLVVMDVTTEVNITVRGARMVFVIVDVGVLD